MDWSPYFLDRSFVQCRIYFKIILHCKYSTISTAGSRKYTMGGFNCYKFASAWHNDDTRYISFHFSDCFFKKKITFNVSKLESMLNFLPQNSSSIYPFRYWWFQLYKIRSTFENYIIFYGFRSWHLGLIPEDFLDWSVELWHLTWLHTRCIYKCIIFFSWCFYFTFHSDF